MYVYIKLPRITGSKTSRGKRRSLGPPVLESAQKHSEKKTRGMGR